jgi:hypothetical protein
LQSFWEGRTGPVTKNKGRPQKEPTSTDGPFSPAQKDKPGVPPMDEGIGGKLS